MAVVRIGVAKCKGLGKGVWGQKSPTGCRGGAPVCVGERSAHKQAKL